MGLVIAIDGPAASGKGTLSKRVAAAFGFAHLDTGALYRAVGVSVLRAGGDPADADFALVQARAFDDSLCLDPEVRGAGVARAASIVSAHPAVRAALLERQRAFADQPGGAVLDGRDIGTVIAPHADAKLFVTASPEVRARRRHQELLRLGRHNHYEDVLIDIRARDERDSSRSTAPLARAEDAYLLDTSELDVDGAIAEAVAAVERRLASA